MHIKIKINAQTIIALSIIFIIAVAFFGFSYIRDRYIINKTKSTFDILKNSYQKTLKTTTYKWTKEDMNTTIFANAFVKNLPTKQVCEYTNNELCFSRVINFKKPPEELNVKSTKIGDYYKVKLNNDTCVAFKILSPTCSHARERCGTIFVDINCTKKPNKFGEDLYDFGIYKDGIRTYIIEANHNQRCINGSGQGCAAYMFKYKNRHYKNYDKYVTRELNKDVKARAKADKKARKALTR